MTEQAPELDFASLWRRIATDHPDRPALIHAELTWTWRRFDAQAATLAQHWRSSGLQRGDVVALALPNRPEHLICLAACLRIGLVPAAVNYRYTGPELTQLLQLLAPAAIVYATEHHDAAAAAHRHLPDAQWMSVGADGAAWADPLAEILQGPAPGHDPLLSGPDDVFIKSTGGTTGRPAALRWRVGDMTANLTTNNPWLPRLEGHLPAVGPVPVADARLLLASPLMHGSGQTRALGALSAGGCVITMPVLSTGAVWRAVEHRRPDTLAIVGDPMARPLARSLERHPTRWDLRSLTTITSSGATWSASVKEQLLTHLPAVCLVETLGATEATGLGASTAVAGQVPATGTFTLGPRALVLLDDGARARVGQIGQLAVAGPHPLGVHPAGELPAHRFTDNGAERYLLSGDHVRLLDLRQVLLLGRDSDCVNIGGEKVYAPEVAQALLEHAAVLDAAVLPQSHPVLGHTLAALVELDPGVPEPDLRAHLERELAPFKIPRTLVRVDRVPRTAAGKLDLAAARAQLTIAPAPSPAKDSAIAADTRSDAFAHLVSVAEHEQHLLEGALASLFTDPALDETISKALGYPDWPQPLTLLPVLAPELADSTPALSAYLAYSSRATGDVIETVARWGWPRNDREDQSVVDAVWLLMQHADTGGEARTELLAEATRAVASGRTDPRHVALLADRIQSLAGKPQRYGTFVLVRDEEPRFLYPLDGSTADVDERRRIIGMPTLAQDLAHAFSPITPYGAGRSTTVNPYRPHRRADESRPQHPGYALPFEPLPAGTVPVYLAATLRHRNEILRLRASLPQPLYSSARWLDLDPLTRASCGYDSGIALNRLAARLCLADVARSKILIGFGMTRRSAGLSTEIGCALAHQVPVVYVGEPSCSFDMLPEVAMVPDVASALNLATRWAAD
ncbi:AMP-binding protein [Streptacidiphilus sp. EB103A]|uniref:AMP-binding protein n=1 Tax=Streptacidiphilus sp. EB103A TaxID=3156275 RepID=UPI0035111FF9